MNPQGGGIRAWIAQQSFLLRKILTISATVAVVGGIITLLGGAVGLLDAFGANTTWREWVLSSTAAAVTVVSLGALAWKEKKFDRHSRYVATLHQQERVTELLRDLRIFLRRFGPGADQPTPEVLARARGMLKEILTIYSQIYSNLTLTRCRFCIKMVHVLKEGNTPPGEDDFLVYSLVRDSASYNEQHENDDRRLAERVDRLKDNSDFVSLFSPKKGDNSSFFSNDLPGEWQYQTSSLHFWRNIIESPHANKQNSWPLWYKSTIVWPVRRDKNEELGILGPTCLGFVTVDSRYKNVFLEEHRPLGKMLANALYPILEHYTHLDAIIASKKGAGA